jgi:hypothetical protein
MVIVLSSSPMHHGFVAISAWKWCSVHLCLRLIVKGGISCLGFLFLLAHSGVQHILCCVLFFYVFCTLCCQFLWMVHFWSSLLYSLTFIFEPWYVNPKTIQLIFAASLLNKQHLEVKTDTGWLDMN